MGGGGGNSGGSGIGQPPPITFDALETVSSLTDALGTVSSLKLVKSLILIFISVTPSI